MHLWASQFWPVFWPGKITGSDQYFLVSRFDFAVSLARRKGGQAKREKREAASIWPKQIQANTGLRRTFDAKLLQELIWLLCKRQDYPSFCSNFAPVKGTKKKGKIRCAVCKKKKNEMDLLTLPPVSEPEWHRSGRRRWYETQQKIANSVKDSILWIFGSDDYKKV